MNRMVLAILAALVVLLTGAPVGADALPPGVRSVEYALTIENLAAYPDHVFFVYPTTNYGFAYRLEVGKGLTSLLMMKGWKGPGSSLYAIRRAEFVKQVAKPAAYPHGDKGETLYVFSPPNGALAASADIAPPALVPLDSPVHRVQRVYRIARLTTDVFELALVQDVATKKDGSPVPQPTGSAPLPDGAPAPPTAPSVPAAPGDGLPPAQGRRAQGCGGCTSAISDDAAGWWALALTLVLRRRRRARG